MSEATRMILGLGEKHVEWALAVTGWFVAISFSYFNDSGFWVFNGMFGLTELKDQVRCKTAVSLIMAGVGIVELFILGIFIH